MNRRAGVWEDAEEAQHAASHQRDLSRSPSPEPEDKPAWPKLQQPLFRQQQVLPMGPLAHKGLEMPTVPERELCHSQAVQHTLA